MSERTVCAHPELDGPCRPGCATFVVGHILRRDQLDYLPMKARAVPVDEHEIPHGRVREVWEISGAARYYMIVYLPPEDADG